MGQPVVAAWAVLLLVVSVQGTRQPDIYSLRVYSEVRNRYAKTLITSRVANPARHAQEVHFDAVLPEKAFISNFVIEMDGVAYHAYVRGKEEARKEYEAAVAEGRGAGHIAVSARDSNLVHVSVNVEAQKKVTFNMSYEELLQRELGAYNLRLDVNPRQVVDDLSVEVRIEEQAPLRLVQVPALQLSNEILDTPDNTMDPLARIQQPTLSTAVVRWAATKRQQQERGADGISGQLVVIYDVDRKASPNQILVSEDGYFVHFYAPPGLPPLQKHVVFVLDVSGSMYGRKIEQLKAAMQTILDELNEGDTFSLIPFASKVQVWQPNKQLTFDYLRKEALTPTTIRGTIVTATSSNIAKAKSSINSFKANGVTHMYEALETALRVSEAAKALAWGRQTPMLVMLTDGEPNGLIGNPVEIVRLITARNEEAGVSLYTLAFGAGADYSFLRRLALRNGGYARRIYEAADAHLQLRNFYRQIASPLLAGVTFKYNKKVDEASLTSVSFPALFRGSELVVAGRLVAEGSAAGVRPWYSVESGSGNATSSAPVVADAPSAERLWAYLTVRQLLDHDAAEPNATVRDKATEIALKYSFVTAVTSLVVVKPNGTSVSDLEIPPLVPHLSPPHRAYDNVQVMWRAAASVLPPLPPQWLHAISMALAALMLFAFK